MIVRILNKLEAKLKSSEIARFLVLTLINLLLFVIAISLSISVGFLLFMNNFTTNFINFIMEWSSKHKNDLLLYGIVFFITYNFLVWRSYKNDKTNQRKKG